MEKFSAVVLVFNLFGSAGNGQGCSAPVSLAYPLDKQPSWSWRTGLWHHVAATYAPSSAGFARQLFWDGNAVTDDAFGGALLDSTRADFYIGSEEDDSTKVVPAKLRRYVDEIALFNEPLDWPNLERFLLDSTTHPGPSGCRWRASEVRNDAVSWPTTTTWDFDSGKADKPLQVLIDDGDWGSGVVAARLGGPGTGKDLTKYKQLRLTADIPDAKTQNGSFEFSLHAGNDVCTWFLSTSVQPYTIDLDEPTFCQVESPARNTCQFPMSMVEWASIRSPSIYPVSQRKDIGKLAYKIERLDLVPRDPKTAPQYLGGVLGPNHWCWRTEAFQVRQGASASLVLDKNALSAHVAGDSNSGPSIVADFGDATYDLSPCTVIDIEVLDGAKTEQGIGSPLVLTIQDSEGAWSQWPLEWIPSGHYRANMDFSKSTNSKSNPDSYVSSFLNPWGKFPNEVKTAAISYLKIQKQWPFPDTVDFVITNVSFLVDGLGTACTASLTR